MNTRMFWNRVKICIRKKGLTQKKTAKAIRVPFSTFRNWMARDINPPLTNANRISRYLGVSLEYLIYGPGENYISQTKEEIFILLKQAEEKLTKIR